MKIESTAGCIVLPPSAHTIVHWLEGLEPYEGKLSSTVLRGGRAGNSPLPLGLVKPGKAKNSPKQSIATNK